MEGGGEVPSWRQPVPLTIAHRKRYTIIKAHNAVLHELVLHESGILRGILHKEGLVLSGIPSGATPAAPRTHANTLARKRSGTSLMAW